MDATAKALRCRALAAGILVLCAMAASQLARAHGNSNLSVSVTAVPSQVTLSQPGAPSFASYQIKITNNTSSNLNDVRFRGTTDVAGNGVALFINPNVSEAGVVLDPNPVVVSTGTVKCTIEGESIDCTVGHHGYLPRGAVASFNAVVRVPVTGTSIVFKWKAEYDIGHSDRFVSGSTTTNLQPAGGDSVSAFIPRAGATLSTGVNAIPTADDPSTTKLTVKPEGSTPIIASIVEDDNGSNSCSPHNKCFGHTITVLKAQTQTKASLGDGLRELLVIVLRRDSSTFFRKDAGIEHVVVLYQVVPAIGGGGTEVRPCRVNGIYTPPGPNAPCIRERTEYPKKKHGQGKGHDHHDHDDRGSPGHSGHNPPSSDLSGYGEIVIEGFDNGRFVW